MLTRQEVKVTPEVLANQNSPFLLGSYLNAAWTAVRNTGLIILNQKLRLCRGIYLCSREHWRSTWQRPQCNEMMELNLIPYLNIAKSRGQEINYTTTDCHTFIMHFHFTSVGKYCTRKKVIYSHNMNVRSIYHVYPIVI